MPKIMRMALTLGAATISISTAFLGLGAPGAEAMTAPSAEADLHGRTNAARGAAGLGALAAADDLVAVARRHAQRMADAGRIFHNSNLPNEVDGWDSIGENVGRAPSVPQVHDAFMASPTHRANIEGAFTQAGMGIVEKNGELWVVEVFRQPSAAPAAAAPAPAPAPRPTAVARPKPAPAPPAAVAAPPAAPAPALPIAAPRLVPVIERVVPKLPPAPAVERATPEQLIAANRAEAPAGQAPFALGALLLLATVAGMTSRRVASQLVGRATT